MAAETATAAFDATARTSDRCDGAGCRPSLQLGWGARDERRPTGTEDSQRGSCLVLRPFSDDGRPAGGGRRHCLSRGRSRGFSGTPWSTSSRSVPTFQFSTCLCRRWGIRWWRCCGGSTCRLSNRLSWCPRSLLTGSPSVLPFVLRRRQNSWWKCRRSPDIHWRSLLCRPWGGGQQRHWRSRSWTIHFLRVGGGGAEVFKVYEQDSVQQRRTWSMSLKFQLVEVSKVSPRPGFLIASISPR